MGIDKVSIQHLVLYIAMCTFDEQKSKIITDILDEKIEESEVEIQSEEELLRSLTDITLHKDIESSISFMHNLCRLYLHIRSLMKVFGEADAEIVASYQSMPLAKKIILIKTVQEELDNENKSK